MSDLDHKRKTSHDLAESPVTRRKLDTASVPQSTSRAYRYWADPHASSQEDAFQESWERPFVGDAADLLWDRIKRHYNDEDARSTTFVQSSGMGKSRTVDELSKKFFTIPVNLRVAESTGYPPADHEVRDFLAGYGFQNDVYLRMCAFLEALFEQTAETIQNEIHGSELHDIASQFRMKMTEGQSFYLANHFRQKFYRDVIDKAEKKFADKRYPKSYDGRIPSPGQSSEQSNISLAQACEKLISVLHGNTAEQPHVLLSFDEAHTITLARTAGDTSWSNFFELHHALRDLHHFPIFSLFVSTAADAFLSMPKSRMTKPFTLVGFDALSRVVSLNGDWSLEDVSSDAHIAHLGRLMFPTLWDAGDNRIRKEILSFARLKLLARHDINNLNYHQILACLSHRLPIEFESRTSEAQADEWKQVEAHMRVCLSIDANFERTVTVSASEPLLSEAASVVMSDPLFKVPEALKTVMERFSIRTRDSKEFIVMLLFITARDKCVKSQRSRTPRILRVDQFLNGGLFRHCAGLQLLAEDFPQSYIHFNHYIKVHEDAVANAESLLLLSSRGAAVRCANDKHRINGINPFLFTGTKLCYNNLGLILWQVTNDALPMAHTQPSLFAAMDPYELDILKEWDDPVPVIKIIFALAAENPSLVVVRRPPSVAYNAVVYEIWCAGISSDILGPVDPAQVTTWEALVQASYSWRELEVSL